jgi:very-short-patch-repair endonuclease
VPRSRVMDYEQKLGRANAMRDRPTKTEARLWDRLRDRQLGRPFLPQWLMHGYIVDFYCPATAVVVEVDGWDHLNTASGRQRDRVLKRSGYTVLHVPAHAVLHDLDGVVAVIRSAMYG